MHNRKLKCAGRCVVLLAALLSGFVSVAQSLSGSWSGSIDVGAAKLPLVFHISDAPAGLTATMDSPAQGAKGIPVDSVSCEGMTVRMAIVKLGVTIEGMWRGVNVGGTSTMARLDGWDVCGKTGTAQNPRGRDHSTFLSFAPKDNPKIAISVYVENGGFGASAALPIASLLEEYYLTDTIRRPALLEYIKNMQIHYPAYDR